MVRDDVLHILHSYRTGQIKTADDAADALAALAQPASAERMAQIDTVIAELQEIRKAFGNTCVYIRRHGISWGAVALNDKAADEKNGVFDLHAEYDKRLQAHNEQVERLKAEREYWRKRASRHPDESASAAL